MFAKLKMEISSVEKISYNKASVFQGVLFERIDPEYADQLHTQNLHPYSQYIYKDEDKLYWVINTLDKESYDRIIQNLMEPEFTSFTIDKGDIGVKILNKTVQVLPKEDLLSELNNVSTERNVSFSIRTPMAFKQKGSYVCFPDLRLIFQNLMNRYSSVSANMVMMDEDTLFQMVDNCQVTRYNLRSVLFPLEGTTIPGAIGYLKIRIKGSQLMAGYARMLFRFAEFSGIGAKTGMGMGAIQLDGEVFDERKRN